MSIDSLKLRARNLQGAIQGMFNHPVKLAHAYELIAQEDGYRNWDTACAAHKAREGSLSIVGDLRINLRNPPFTGASGGFIEHLIRENPRFELLLESLPARRHAIVVVSGLAASGKSTLLQEIMARISQNLALEVDQSKPGETGDENKSFDAALAAALRSHPSVVYMPSINNEHRLQAATQTVLTGTLVITSIWGQEDASGRDLLLGNMKNGFCPQAIQELHLVDIVHLHLTRTA